MPPAPVSVSAHLRLPALLSALVFVLPGIVFAQKVGDNVNILPVYKTIGCSTDPTTQQVTCSWQDDGFDYIRGNLFGQRLNEPSILVSSRNKDHIIVFFNDYRAVNVSTDQAIPSTTSVSPIAALWNGTKTFFARLAGLPGPSGNKDKDKDKNVQPGDPDHAAFSQAGVGCTVSYDGGITWAGCFVPGMPFDTKPASVVSPSYVLGLQGMSDPAVVAGKCGKGYLADIAFTYGQASEIQVHTVQDQNDSDKVHTWTWNNIADVSDCNNSNWGCFVDKPAIAVGPPPVVNNSCSGVTETVYTTFTTFTGTTGTGSTKFQSKVTLATSTDGGKTFSTQTVDGNYTSVQGTALQVNQVATSYDPASTVFVFYRTFNSPSSIIMRRSTTSGSGWAKPIDIIAAGSANTTLPTTLQTFDQPTTPLATGGPAGLSFRSNAFPAVAMTPDGKVLICTFQERGNPSTGLPSTAAGNIPLIMMTYSTDGGRTWSPRKALSYQGNRAEVIGLGFFNTTPTTAPGPQVQPAVSCSTNSTCMVTWMESPTALSSTGWIAGYDRKMNHRALALQIQNGVPVANPAGSIQVSRYSYDDDTQPTTDDPSQVEQIRESGLMFPMWNFFNYDNYSAGTEPFDGDYTDIRPLTSNTFLTAFTDNRYVVPPLTGTGGTTAPWQNFVNYGTWPQSPCNNPGSRAQTLMAAPISNGLVVTTPANYKTFNTTTAPAACDPLPGMSTPQQCIEFPFTVWNNTDNSTRYKIWLSGTTTAAPPGAANASFAKGYSSAATTDPSYYVYPLKDGGLNINGHSSNTANVYAFDGSPVTVNIAQCPSTGCTGFTPSAADTWVTFNAPANAPPSGSQGTFTYSPSAVTVSGRNVNGQNVSGRNSLINVSGRNVSGRNVSGRNSALYDPTTNTYLTAYNVIDYSVDVTAASNNDMGSYLSLFNVDQAYTNDYVFQVLVTKPLTSFTTSPSNCQPLNSLDGALVGQATVSGRNIGGLNVSGRNVSGRNPVPVDGDVTAQAIQNTSFTLGSSTTPFVGAGGGGTVQTNFGCTNGWGRIGECTQAAPRLPNTVTVTLRAYQITPTPARIFDPTAAPPSIGAAEFSCKTSACLAATGPDLAVPNPPPAPSTLVSPSVLPAGAYTLFPDTSITITNIGQNCADGGPCGTAQAHRWGIYLSTAATIAAIPRYAPGDACPSGDPTQCVPGMIKVNVTDTTKPITALLLTGTFAPLAVGGTEIVGAQNVQIPAAIPRLNADGTGTYYAYLYVDDQRVVSELNEDNNIVQGGPITVTAPGYGFLGLQTPCSGMSCTKTGTLPLAWQFTSGGVPVDTIDDLPNLKFWLGCGQNLSVDTSGYPNGSPLAQSSPSPTNLTSGSSGWQYFPTAGLSRPQYSWQFNFGQTGLPTGVCYTMWIEVPSTGQVVKPPNPNVKPIGPFSITPQ